jgi:hypothetical protein
MWLCVAPSIYDWSYTWRYGQGREGEVLYRGKNGTVTSNNRQGKGYKMKKGSDKITAISTK